MFFWDKNRNHGYIIHVSVNWQDMIQVDPKFDSNLQEKIKENAKKLMIREVKVLSDYKRKCENFVYFRL